MNRQAVISLESPLAGRLVKFSPETAGSTAGNLASAIVPVVILAALARLVAVVAVPVTLPVTLPVKFPSKDVDVVTPVTTAPSGNVGEVPAVLPLKLVTLKFDIRDLRFVVHQ